MYCDVMYTACESLAWPIITIYYSATVASLIKYISLYNAVLYMSAAEVS